MSQTIEKKPGCIQAALDIIGDKWTALVIRDLWTGPKRFNQLQASLGKISPRTLSQRLDKLELCQVLSKQEEQGVVGRFAYVLTDKGHDFAGILEQMAQWGEKYYQADHSDSKKR